MATLTIRNIPDEIRDRLRERAARAGRSMEAELRRIVEEAALAADQARSARALQEWVDEIYGGDKPRKVVDELLAERRREASIE